MITRTIGVRAGNVVIGGGAPITVQSMTNTDTRDVEATVAQIQRLERAGCEIVRVAVPDEESAQAIRDIKAQIGIPLVADIQFDHRLALASIQSGVDKLRINPGNIGPSGNVRELVAAAKANAIPIRIGVNAGSLSRDILSQFGGPTPEALVESALSHVSILESEGFYDIVLSLKSSSVPVLVEACRIMAARTRYPIHLGVTEAGLSAQGLIKSAMGIGALLIDGIGDTIRVSLTGDPVKEVKAGYLILRSAGVRKSGVEIVSCPTCGRCCVDLESVARDVESRLPRTMKYLKVAIMGCVVNGPGEARESDIGIAFGETGGVVFKHGKKLASLPVQEAVSLLIEEIEKMSKGA